MRNSILKMAGSNQRSINRLPQTTHSATICGQTGCGKRVFILDLLPYRGFFHTIVVLAQRYGITNPISSATGSGRTPEVYLLDPGGRLHYYMLALYHVFMGEPTLYIIDDCSASTALTNKKDMLSMLAFSGRHAEHLSGSSSRSTTLS